MTFDGRAALDFWTDERRAEIQAEYFRRLEAEPATLEARALANRLEQDERAAIREWS